MKNDVIQEGNKKGNQTGTISQTPFVGEISTHNFKFGVDFFKRMNLASLRMSPIPQKKKKLGAFSISMRGDNTIYPFNL